MRVDVVRLGLQAARHEVALPAGSAHPASFWNEARLNPVILRESRRSKALLVAGPFEREFGRHSEHGHDPSGIVAEVYDHSEPPAGVQHVLPVEPLAPR